MEKHRDNLDNTQNWQSMDLANGSVQSYFSLPNNEIHTKEHSTKFMILMVFIYSIIRPASLCLIATLITIIIMPDSSPFKIEMYIVELVFLLAFSIFKEIYFDKIKEESDSSINKRTVNVCRNNQDFEEITWGELKQGDIVYLEQGQVAPADMLLLDSQQIEHREAMTYVDVINVNGSTVCEKKKSCYLTQIVNRSSIQKRVWKNYRNVVSGKLRFQKATGQIHNFVGYLKIAKDPKLEKLSIQNLILRESSIKTSLWVYGIVLYPGMDSKIMNNFKEGNKSRKWIISKIDYIFIIHLLVNIILGAIFSLCYIFTDTRVLSNYFILAYHFLMFSVALPVLLYIAIDLFLIMFRFLSNRQKIQIRNYSNIQDLGEIDYAFVTNVGIITTGRLQIDEIVTDSSIYKISKEEKKVVVERRPTQMMRKRRMASSMRGSTSMPPNRNLLYPIPNMEKKNENMILGTADEGEDNFEIDDNSNVRMKMSPLNPVKAIKQPKLLDPLILDKMRFNNDVMKGQTQSTNIVKCMILCHQAKLNYKTANDKYHGISSMNSGTHYEEVLLKLANFVGWKIQSKIVDKKEVGLIATFEKQVKNEKGIFEIVKEKILYNWVGINTFHIKRNLFSIVVSRDKKVTLYCKGRAEDIMERLKVSKETQKIIDTKLTSFADKSEVIFYAKRQLGPQQLQLYRADYIGLTSSLTTTQVEIDEFSKKYEKDLQFVCLIGMSIEIAPLANHLTQNISKSGIKMCMFGNERTQITLLKKLLVEDRQVKEIRLQKESTELIKYYLNEATNRLKNNKNFEYILIASGPAWRHMIKNSQVLQHFMFVLHHSQGVLAYDFQAQNIAEMTRITRYSYPREQKILGIGYSYTDLKFLGESNVGIGLSKDLPADIKAQGIQKIEQVIELGPYLLEAIISLVNLVLYKTIILTVIVLLYQIVLMTYRVSNTLEGNLVFFYVIIFNGLEILYAMIYHREPKRLENQALYMYYRTVSFRTTINILEACIHGTVIFLSVYFTLPQVRISDGRVLPIEAFHLSIFIVLISVGNFKKIFSPIFKKKCVVIGTIINYIVMALCVFAGSMLNSDFKKVGQQFVYLFSNYDSVMMMINTTIFCLAISLFLNEVSKKKLLPTLLEKKGQKKESIENEKENSEFTNLQLIQHLFKDEETMESSLGELVADEMDVNIMKVNKILQIKNQEESIKYQFQRFTKYQTTFTRTFFIMTILQIIIITINVSYIENEFKLYIITLIIGAIFSFIVTLYGWKGNPQMNYYILAETCMVIMTVIFILFCILQNQNHYFLLIILIVTFFTQILQIRLPILIIISASILIMNMILLILSSQSIFEKIFQTVLTAIAIIVNFILIFRYSTNSKTNFIITENFLKQKNYVNDILSILVPKFIKNHLQEHVSDHQLQQEESKVSILFCYVCNFDEMVKEQGTNIVLLMDELFRQFDELCHNYAVQKIQTVGMTYMASTGINAYEAQIQTEMKRKNQVQRLLKMAIQMLDKTKDIMWGTKKNKKLNIKIGINSGNVVIGVIGHHKPQFSLIGDVVNTTSRHCSTANPGQIVLSQVSYKMLKKISISAFSRSKKEMKGLGEVNVYRYSSNQVTQARQKMIISKFQRCVNIVIEDLKAKGLIDYKKNKAKKMAEMFFFSPNRDRMQSQGIRKSTTKENLPPQMEELSEQYNSGQNKQGQFELNHNVLLELTQENKSQNKSKFRNYLIRKYLKTDRILIGILLLSFLIMFIIEITVGTWSYPTLSLKIIATILFPIMIILYRKALKSKPINILMTCFQCYIIIIMIIKEIIISDKKVVPMSHQIYLYPMLAIIICSCQASMRFLHIIVMSILTIILTAIYQGIKQEFEMQIIYEFFYFLFILIRKYEILRETYKNYSQTLLYEKKTQEQSALVSQLLPKHAYEKLKNQNIQNRLELTDKFQRVTMLFADIKGFTKFSNQSTPVGVVKMLRSLFLQFDKLCLKNNVYKVYTVGDCYVVLGFTNCYQRDYLEEAKNVVNMGLAMVESIQKIRQKLNFMQLDMRIGIHTGTIIGGIIGTQIVRYDIYGPDVMIANKFQENGIIGHIHISQSTKQILEQDKKLSYNIVSNGRVKIEKLNAEYNGYILSKKKFEV